MNCSIAQSLEVVGEWWTLLLVREAMFFGARRFKDFQEAIGIADNILTERLRKLVAHGVFERIPANGIGRRAEYRLTQMGRALFPVLISLMQWGDRWIAGTRCTPVKILEKVSQAEVTEMNVENKLRFALTPDDIILIAGPGATAATRQKLSQTMKHAAQGSSHSHRASERQIPR